MWSSSLRQEEHLYFVSLPSLEGFFFPQRSTSQSLEMTPNKKPKLNAELLPPCTRVLSQTCITRCCCNSSSAWSQRSSCAFRSARSPPTPTPPPFRQQGGLKCLTGSSCVAVAICHRVYCCPPDSHLSDRFTGTSETLNALSLPCRKCLLNQSFFWKTVEISTQLSAVTLNPLRASTFTPAAGRDVGVVGWWGGWGEVIKCRFFPSWDEVNSRFCVFPGEWEFCCVYGGMMGTKLRQRGKPTMGK